MQTVPTPDNQDFSDTTLKGFLLKGIDKKSDNPTILALNKILTAQVDRFWEAVVIPLRKSKQLNGNKINWYFQIYKEGYEARKLAVHPFTAMTCDEATVKGIIEEFKDKTLPEYIELGTSYLANAAAILNAWTRDQTLLKRLATIYSSDQPHEWIIAAEREERGIMKDTAGNVPGLRETLNNITILMAKRV